MRPHWIVRDDHYHTITDALTGEEMRVHAPGPEYTTYMNDSDYRFYRVGGVLGAAILGGALLVVGILIGS